MSVETRYAHGMVRRIALGFSAIALVLGVLAFAACSNSTTTTPNFGDDGFGDSGAASNPCGANGVFGAFQINGTLDGTESICGLNLGSFDGGTLTIANSNDAATVTVTGSGAGYIDIASCAATVSGCNVTTSTCNGSTNSAETISLSLSVAPNALSGTSQISYSSCSAPGFSFNGTR